MCILSATLDVTLKFAKRVWVNYLGQIVEYIKAMSKTRLSRRVARAVGIDHSDIKYDTTCINMVPGGLPISLVGEICHGKLDTHTK